MLEINLDLEVEDNPRIYAIARQEMGPHVAVKFADTDERGFAKSRATVRLSPDQAFKLHAQIGVALEDLKSRLTV